MFKGRNGVLLLNIKFKASSCKIDNTVEEHVHRVHVNVYDALAHVTAQCSFPVVNVYIYLLRLCCIITKKS